LYFFTILIKHVLTCGIGILRITWVYIIH
jgi:hypothetical protein